MILKGVLFVLGGAVIGFAYQRLIGCRTGTCPLTSNPYISTLYGALVGLFVSGSLRYEHCMKPTKTMTNDDFNAQVSRPGIVILDFWAGWCGPCRAFAPIFEAAAVRHPDIVWGKVDIDAEPELAAALGIRSIPTLMGFRDGVLLFEQPGLLPAAALDMLVSKVRELDMDEVRRANERPPVDAGANPAR